MRPEAGTKSSLKMALGTGAAILSLALGILGMGILVRGKNQPGSSRTEALKFPAGTRQSLHPTLPTLLVFLHPLCPCSRATLHELERLLASCGSHLSTRVLLVRPAGADDRWCRTETADLARAIPGVRVEGDEGGEDARLFGATTSGQVLLYDPLGILRFQGGITASRGHEGDNAGRSAIVSIILQDSGERARTPVFGCALLNDQSREELP